MKIERTFVFVAILALAVLGYGITGAVVFNPQEQAACEEKCLKIAQENVDACYYNGTFYKKDFFVENFCNRDLADVCKQQFCGVATNLPVEKIDQCKALCSR